MDPFLESIFAFSLLQYQTECLTLPSVLYYTPSPHLRVILHSPLLMSHTLSVLSYEPLTTLSSSTCHQRKVIKWTEQHNVENSVIFSTGMRWVLYNSGVIWCHWGQFDSVEMENLHLIKKHRYSLNYMSHWQVWCTFTCDVCLTYL